MIARAVTLWATAAFYSLSGAPGIAQSESNQDARGIRVTGKLHYSIPLKPEPDERTREPSLFKAQALGASWALEVIKPNGLIEAIGCDGTNVFQLSQFPMESDQETGEIPALGTICKGSYPLMAGSILVSVPWLAYCSGFTLNDQSRQPEVLPALWMPSYSSPLAHIYTCTFVPIETSIGVPAVVEYFPDMQRLSRVRNGDVLGAVALPSEEMKRQATRAANKYSKWAPGTPEAVYMVSELAQLGGIRLPKHFRFERFLYGDEGGRSAGKSVEVVEGFLDSAEFIDALEVLPRPIEGVKSFRVADYRFFDPSAGVQFVDYRTEDEWIRDESTESLVRAVEETKRTSRRAKDGKLPPLLVLSAFVAIVSLPLAVRPVRRRIGKILGL